ncbi:MAG TPA: hypothetical protein VFG42_02495 [Baekduia sp.]|nr:hypothetical protein [Baekduia sp.]
MASLALLVPAAAHATTDVVANPAPGLASVRLSDEDQAGTISVRVTPSSPIADGDFSAVLFDTNNDGAGDRAIVATRAAGTTTVTVLRTTQSTSSCQQLRGSGATAISGATKNVASDGSSYTVTVPVAALPGTFRWKALGTEPDSCGGTDAAILTADVTLSGAHSFAGSGVDTPDTTAPAAPAGLTVVGGDKTATLDWADNTEDDLAGYLVYRRVQGGAFSLVAQPTDSALTDTGLLNGTTYEYYVRAKDASGNLSPESVKVAVTPAAPVPPGGGTNNGGTNNGGTNNGGTNNGGGTSKVPAAPGRPKVKKVTSKLVVLTWASRKGVSKYRVFRRLKGHRWSKTALAVVKRTGYTDKHVKPGTTYQYRIVGVTADGKATQPSPAVTVTTKRAKAKAKKKSHR